MYVAVCVLPTGSLRMKSLDDDKAAAQGPLLASFPYFGHCPTMTNLSSMWYWMFFCCCRQKSIICIWYETMRLIGFSQVSQAWSTPKVVNSEKSTRVQTSWYEHFQMHLKFGYGFFVFLSGGSLLNNKEDIAGRFEVSILLHLCVLMCSPSCCFK